MTHLPSWTWCVNDPPNGWRQPIFTQVLPSVEAFDVRRHDLVPVANLEAYPKVFARLVGAMLCISAMNHRGTWATSTSQDFRETADSSRSFTVQPATRYGATLVPVAVVSKRFGKLPCSTTSLTRS